MLEVAPRGLVPARLPVAERRELHPRLIDFLPCQHWQMVYWGWRYPRSKTVAEEKLENPSCRAAVEQKTGHPSCQAAVVVSPSCRAAVEQKTGHPSCQAAVVVIPRCRAAVEQKTGHPSCHGAVVDPTCSFL